MTNETSAGRANPARYKRTGPARLGRKATIQPKKTPVPDKDDGIDANDGRAVGFNCKKWKPVE